MGSNVFIGIVKMFMDSNIFLINTYQWVIPKNFALNFSYNQLARIDFKAKKPFGQQTHKISYLLHLSFQTTVKLNSYQGS